VRAYHETYGLETTISNCSNNYGPYQFPEKLIPLIIINILHGKSLPVYGDGKQIRDWLFVDDHNLGVDLILHNGTPGRTYNIGGNNEWQNIDIVNLVCTLLHKRFLMDTDLQKKYPKSPTSKKEHPKTLITHVKDRLGHDRRYAIDPKLIIADLNYKPGEMFSTGIKKTIEWILSNSQWWGSILDESYLDWIDKNYQT